MSPDSNRERETDQDAPLSEANQTTILTMKEPLSRIQLALQGGGAKLSALLAVAEGVQQLNDAKIIQLERIAGTSAGAIAGALLAAGVPIPDVRRSLRGGKGAELVAAFPPISSLSNVDKAKMGWKFLAGDPFWSTAVLEKWLREIFREVGVVKIGDCQKVRELNIMAANMSTSEMKVFDKEEDLVAALMASAGIPVCFRTWKSTDKNGQLLIDGGIGENLPIDRLSMETNRFGELVAVTFKTAVPDKPEDGIVYASTVLGTAIDVSVRRAASRIPSNRLFIAETQVSTFDFKSAISIGLEDPEYSGIRDKALAFFAAIPHQPADIDPWEIREPSMALMMADLARVYEQNFAKPKLHYEELVTVATARCLLPLNLQTGPEPDEVQSIEKFKPIKDPVSCIALSVAGFAGGRKYLGRLSPELRDAQGKLIGCTPVPSLPTGRPIGPDEKQLLVFFDKPLLPRTGNYTFTFRDVGPNIMWPLRQTGEDVVAAVLPRAEGTIKKAIFILYVPERYPRLEITTMPPQSGIELPDKEFLRLNLKPPNGFRAIGWMFENINADELFGVRYRDPGKKTA